MSVAPARAGDGPDAVGVLRRVVDHARRAPSIHNTQPWGWRLVDHGLELWADRSRMLEVTDPEGRNLVISCGTALQHAVVAAQALGLASRVEHLPDAGRPALLARLAFEPTPYREGDELHLRAIEERCTDRRRFTSWPVPEERVRDLAEAVRPWGADATPITDAAVRFRLELLVEDALREQLRDAAVLAEERDWVERGSRPDSTEGVPLGAVPALSGLSGERRSRFAAQVVGEPPSRRLGEATDGLLVISTREEGPTAWLHAGEALSALWLRATLGALSVVPLSQVIEVAATRRVIEELVLQGDGHAHILVRVGWQEIGRRNTFRTPRRPLDDVLLVDPPHDRATSANPTTLRPVPH